MTAEHAIDASLLLTVQQVAKLLQVSPRSVWRLRSAGEIPEPVKIGGMSRWPRSEISAVIERAKAERAA